MDAGRVPLAQHARRASGKRAVPVPSHSRHSIGERGTADWTSRRTEIEEEVQAFWDQFEPDIDCDGVEVLGTDEITLADIEPYQRFDADWVSFEDETSTTPPVVDMVS